MFKSIYLKIFGITLPIWIPIILLLEGIGSVPILVCILGIILLLYTFIATVTLPYFLAITNELGLRGVDILKDNYVEYLQANKGSVIETMSAKLKARKKS